MGASLNADDMEDELSNIQALRQLMMQHDYSVHGIIQKLGLTSVGNCLPVWTLASAGPVRYCTITHFTEYKQENGIT